LEDELATALGRPPCLVSFSGGRDSSGLLALAAKVSREMGLPAPIPVTMLFPGDSAAEEGEWQRTVVGDLGLDDWVRIEVPPRELDAVGPVAQVVLKRHGLLWPPNLYMHYPILQQARGGSLVTGFGGDEVAQLSASARAERLVVRQQRAGPADLLVTLSFALAPKALRAVAYRLRFHEELPWLTKEGYATARAAVAAENAAYPFGFDRKLRLAKRSRYRTTSLASLEILGASLDVRSFSPLAADAVMDAVAAKGGIPGLGYRADLVRLLFGGVLSPAVLARTSKSSFTTQVLSEASVSFAAQWSGEGLDGGLVDPQKLRQHWLSDQRSAPSTALLQAAWLNDNSASAPPVGHQPPSAPHSPVNEEMAAPWVERPPLGS
jgi:asparagine synthase (glutamine-hydrolysing)